MTETLSIHLPAFSGTGTLNLFLRRTDNGVLLNASGDTFTESPGASGRFLATLNEARTGLNPLAASVCDGIELPDNLVWDGWLAEDDTVITDTYPQAILGTVASANLSIHLPAFSGVSTLKLYLRRIDTGALLNSGGDSLTETPAGSGRFTATLAESRTGLGTLVASVCDGSESPDNLVWDGWLADDDSIVNATYPQMIDSSGGGSGTGPRTVTITVDDGVTPLQNAVVRLSEGTNWFAVVTNASGVAVFNLDDATYSVIITKAGYSFGGDTLLVDGDEAATYSMTATGGGSSDPPLCTVTIPVRDQYGNPLVGEPVEIRFNRFTADADATAVILSPPPPQVSDADGNVIVVLWREAEYSIFYGQECYKKQLDFTVPDAGSFTVGE